MKIICGLGNIGTEYINTRHNLGFNVIESLAESNNLSFKNFEKILDLARLSFSGIQVLLVKPYLYVNRSGIALRRVMDYYKVDVKDILVVVDDYQLDLGKIRCRPNGSAGGHNGLKSIISNLSTQDFARLRLGIGHPPKNIPLESYVLSKFKSVERKPVKEMINLSQIAIQDWLENDMHFVMNKYN